MIRVPQLDLKRQHAALASELRAAADRVLTSAWFIMGPEGRALEAELADACGARHGVGANSGTDALLLALTALGVKAGDEVITSAFSFVASGTTIALAGATPVFVDIDPATYNIDPGAVEKAITPRTRAIVPVHLYGQCADMTAISDIARARGLAVIADAAQAVGGSYADRPIGAWGDAVCLSFYPTKNLGACGDGGMLLTTRDDVAERVRRLRDHGSARRYEHVELGYSSRLDDLQAAFLRVKLRHLGEWTAARRRLAGRYRELLAGLSLTLPVERPPAVHVYHQFTVRVPDRDEVARRLAELGVGTTVHYPIPIPAQPLFCPPGAEERVAAAYPESTRAAREVLSLPCYPEITDAELGEVAAALRTTLTQAARA
jgi:UDP-N-acetyl-3-dehydro-alpha-D-glucosamine 3-aminotranferase